MQKIGDIPNTRADSHGEFTDGNVAGGVSPTILPAEWFNTIQRELINVLAAGGVTPDTTKFNQLATAISKIITDGGFLKTANNLSEIKAAGQAAVAQTLANLGLGEVIAAAAANALKKSANLSDVTNASKSLSNIGGFASKGDLGTTNLNALGDRATSAGVWYQPTDILATSAANYPIQSSGTLLVTQSAYGCQQEYTTYSGLKFVRGLTAEWNGAGPWSEWKQISAQQPKTVTTRDYIRIPDVPGGLIIQWFAGPSSTGESSMGPLSFPIAFPTACVFSSVSTLGNGTGSCDQMFQVTSTNLNSITLFSQVFGSGSVPGTANPLVFAIGY